MNRKCADPWSPSERKMKSIIEKTKGMLFNPLVALLLKLKITANAVSYFSSLIGLISALYLFVNIKYAAIFLLASFIVDGIDGSLARASKQDSLQGSVTDCFCDQIVISSTTIGFIAIGLLNPIVGGLYLATYPIVIIFSVIRNLIGSPRAYVLRPRMIIYFSFLLYAFTDIDIIDMVVLPLALLLLLQVIIDFYFLRDKLND